MSIAEPTAVFSVGDARGRLCAIETGREVPFAIERVYYLTGTAPHHPRGFHAHRATRQFAVCLRGSCRMVMEDLAGTRREFPLDDPERGILIEPMVWHEMHDFEADTVLLVLADRHYDEADYIRSREVWESARDIHDT